MRDWLTIELVLAALLVTSFTCVGLLALWAANSPRHWFIRTAVFVAALSPLLLIPAYEPFVAFVLQGATVAGCVRTYRWWRNRRERSDLATSTGASTISAGIRFSLSTLLLLMAIVAVATPIVMMLPVLNIRAWGSVLVIGAATGLVTAAAALMFASNRKLRVWPIGLLLCLLAGVALSQIDWFAHAVVRHTDWPPQPPPTTGAKILGGAPEPLPIAWPLTLPSMAALLVLMLFALCFARDTKRPAVRIGVAAIVVVVAAFPLGILWSLLHPQPIPDQQLPQPNGYDEFVAAGKAFNTSPILNTSVQPTSTAQLAAEVAKFAPSFDRVRFALTLPCKAAVAPIEPNMPFNFPFNDVQTIRSVARAMNCKAEMALQQKSFRDAALISIDNIRIGHASARGGLVPHYLVGIAVQGIGMASLHQAAGHLDAAACDEIIAALESIDENREPLDAMIQRDRVYCENAWGWYGHLMLILDDITGDHPGYWATREATLRSSAVCRLLTLELAIRQYRLDTGTLPTHLEELVPHYASRLPIDPYDPEQRSLRYVPTENEYLLYSVGYDTDDDGGRPSSQDSGWFGDGDLRLDAFFAPDDGPDAAADEANLDGKGE